MLRRSVVLALFVFAAGFVLIWLGLWPLPGEPFLFCPDVPQIEGLSLSTGPALWPPGAIRCDFGSRGSSVYVPWREWLSLAFLAAGVGVAVAGRLVVSACLFVLAVAAAFV